MAEDRPRIHPLSLLRECLVIYRVHWLALVGAAAAVFLPLAVLDALVEHHADEETWELAGLELIELLLHLFGDVFYTGIVAAAVIAWRRGGPRSGPLEVARRLSWGTILALDLVLSIATVVGLIALVVPGVMIYVYFSLAPAYVKIDHLGFTAALRASARAVHGNFWRILLVFLILVPAAAALKELLQMAVDEFLGHVAVTLVVDLVGAPFYGLATVLMAFELRSRITTAIGH